MARIKQDPLNKNVIAKKAKSLNILAKNKTDIRDMITVSVRQALQLQYIFYTILSWPTLWDAVTV